MDDRLADEPLRPPSSTIEIVPTRPPMLQTMVESDFGLIPCMRARSGLPAAARTVRPSKVRLRNHVRASATRGTATSTRSCGPFRRTVSVRFQILPIAIGYE